MSSCEQIKFNILILITLFFLMLVLGGPTGPTTAFAVEMPPVPGQVYHKSSESGQESGNVESLPPSVKKMDEQIKEGTKVLRRGFISTSELETKIEPESESKAESETEQSIEAKPENNSPSTEVVVKSGTEQPVVETETSMSLKKETQSDSYAPSEDKEAEVADGDQNSKVCAIGVATSSKVSYIGFFLKGLIIFTMVGIAFFAFLRKFVFKT